MPADAGFTAKLNRLVANVHRRAAGPTASAREVAVGAETAIARPQAASGPRAWLRRWWPLRAAFGVVTVTPLLRWGVAALAVPAGQTSRRTCPACATPFGLGSNADAGVLSPTGRCRGCGTRVGAPPYTIEAAALVVAAVLPASGLRGWELAAYAWWAVLALVLSFVDVVVQRLPNRLVFLAAGGFLVLTIPAALAGRHGDWLRAMVSGAALATVLAVLAFIPGSGLGLGDAKFALAAGAAAGWVSVFAVMAAVFWSFVALALFGAVLIAARRASWRTRIPYGPFLAAATLATVVALR